ncbi:hypothetical protein [Pseudomonas izuensis]|uniref:hypothetical protein n=1 Tax=Pseudomonas izuensis TaxID=2684212 RepID=UPI001358EFC0|nr:hypothetical protein [Pseudomonas izuensis]
MSAFIQITTHPQVQSYIEHCLEKSLPEGVWALKRQTDDGRLWLLTLSVDPCSREAEWIVQSLLMNGWIMSMDFSAPHGMPA